MTRPDDLARRLAEIDARVKAATEGPWEWSGSPDSYYRLVSRGAKDWCQTNIIEVVEGTVYSEYSSDGVSLDVGQHNADFIAHARSDVEWLLAALRAHTQAAVSRERAECKATFSAADDELRQCLQVIRSEADNMHCSTGEQAESRDAIDRNIRRADDCLRRFAAAIAARGQGRTG